MTDSAYGNLSWLHEYLDLSRSQFQRKRRALEAEGFPKPDPILGKYLKADVRAWVESRRTVRDPGKVEESTTTMKVNDDAL